MKTKMTRSKLEKELKREREFSLTLIIIFIIAAIVLVSVLNSKEDLQEELTICQEQVPSWELKLHCNHQAPSSNGTIKIDQTMDITFDNYDAYLSFLKDFQDNNELNCVVIE